MSSLREQARIAARALFPNKDWGPIDAWADPRYHAAFLKNKATDDELEAQRNAFTVGDLRDAPSFSIITPLFETPRDFLDDLVGSVLAQTYPKFELVLVNASPNKGALAEQARSYADLDARIKVITLEKNLGITENTYRGIDAATGDYVCFVDHDDWIEPDTLFEFATTIMGDSAIDMLYCDEDIVTLEKASWKHMHPFFKAAFSPEHLLCTNYIIHLLTVRRSLVNSLPAADCRFDGSQDYNLVLKISERTHRVHHVPKVLYHWRVGENSTADNIADKPYAKRANRLAIQEHLERSLPDTNVIGSGIVSLHNIWFRPTGAPKVSLIVDARDGADAFLEAFRQVNSYENCEIVLVGDSRGQSKAAPIKLAPVAEGTGLFELLNEGARCASGDILVFCSPDCQFCSPEPLEQTAGMLGVAGVGIMGPRTLFADLSVKSFGVGVTASAIMPLYRGYDRTDPGYHCNNRVFENTSAVSWQGLSLTKDLFERLDGFDTSFVDEVGAADLCRRARMLGQRIVVSCTVEMATGEWPAERRFDYKVNRPDFNDADIARFYEKWPEMRDSYDPYWNPHLDQVAGYPSIGSAYLAGEPKPKNRLSLSKLGFKQGSPSVK